MDNFDFLSLEPNPNSNTTETKEEQILQINQPTINEEEQKRIEAREKEAAERREKIQEKINKEIELRNKMREKAGEFMTAFLKERHSKIQENHQKLLQMEEEWKSQKNKEQSGENSVNTWEKVTSNIDTKEGDYKGSKNVSRMKEIIMNKKNDNLDVPEAKTFFG